MNFIKKIYHKLFAPKPLSPDEVIIRDWENAGKPAPPPHIVKQNTISTLRTKFGYDLFIETGTYLGDMINAQRNNFRQLYSIELSKNLFAGAVKRFSPYANVTILQGDSGVVLINLCKKINHPAIFWLDGHYSAGITARGEKFCPIYEELAAIFNSKPLKHILLIDDARLFSGQDDYPTIPELTEFIKKSRPEATITIEDDIIKAYL